jgi:poly(A) polymerase
MGLPVVLIDALHEAQGAAALRVLDEEGGLTRLIPELELGRGFVQPERHHYDVLDHNLAAVAALDAVVGGGAETDDLREALSWIDLEQSLERSIEGLPLVSLIRLGCLLHDVGKPASAVRENGRLRFPRHGPRGAELMKERLPELGFGPEATDFVAKMVRYHLRPGELVKAWPATDRAVRKFVSDLDGQVLPLLLVNLSDGMATRGPGYTREHYRRHCGFINYVLARAWAVSTEESPSPLLNGDDLIAELDLESGTLVGRVLTSVRRSQLEGAISNRDEALALARTVLAELGTETSQR